jgi:ribokinase
MNQIVIIGSANIDITHKGERFPNRGETLSSDNSYISLGGKGLNQSVAASRLNKEKNVKFIGSIGNDGFGDKIKNDLLNESIDLSDLKTINDDMTGNAIIYIDSENNNQISVYPGANSRNGSSEVKIFTEISESISIVMLQQEIPIETNYKILEIAKSKNITTILDPGPPNNDFKNFPKYLKFVDFLTPNKHEAEFILGEKITGNELKAAKEIKNMGPKNVIITLGKDGIVFAGEENGKLPAYKVNSIDPVGSGDCFNGAFAIKINEKSSIRSSLDYAQYAASISTLKLGACESFPKFTELDKDFNALKRISN